MRWMWTTTSRMGWWWIWGRSESRGGQRRLVGGCKPAARAADPDRDGESPRMVQILLIAAFMAMFLRDAAPGLWFARIDGRVVSAVVLGSMAGLWLAAHAVIAVQGRRLDRQGDYR